MREWAELKQFVTANMNHLSGTAVMETLYSSYRSVYQSSVNSFKDRLDDWSKDVDF